jgi:hypothetical protein
VGRNLADTTQSYTPAAHAGRGTDAMHSVISRATWDVHQDQPQETGPEPAVFLIEEKSVCPTRWCPRPAAAAHQPDRRLRWSALHNHGPR